jgi:hypothetical protein
MHSSASSDDGVLDVVVVFATIVIVVVVVEVVVVRKAWNIIVLVSRTPRPRQLQGAIIKYINILFQHPPLIEACRCQSRD